MKEFLYDHPLMGWLAIITFVVDVVVLGAFVIYCAWGWPKRPKL